MVRHLWSNGDAANRQRPMKNLAGAPLAACPTPNPGASTMQPATAGPNRSPDRDPCDACADRPLPVRRRDDRGGRRPRSARRRLPLPHVPALVRRAVPVLHGRRRRGHRLGRRHALPLLRLRRTRLLPALRLAPVVQRRRARRQAPELRAHARPLRRRARAGRCGRRSTSTARWPASSSPATIVARAGPTTRPRIRSSRATSNDGSLPAPWGDAR